MFKKSCLQFSLLMLLSVVGCTKKESASTAPSVDAEMVLFEGGSFMMGSDAATEAERPAHSVEVKSFYLDKHPVTVKQFRAFVQATNHRTDAEKFGDSGVYDFTTQQWRLMPGATWQYPLGPSAPQAKENDPVTHVSWNDAVAFAKWAGKRLPSEAEWEYAARCGGKSNSRYSWGDQLIVDGKYRANVWQGTDLTSESIDDGFKFTSPVGYYGETACGLTDMGGNVWNWCQDSYLPYPGSTLAGPAGEDNKVIRGGSFFFDQALEGSYTVTYRAGNTQETSLFNLGFRCAKDKE